MTKQNIEFTKRQFQKELQFMSYPADVAIRPKTDSRSVQVGWEDCISEFQQFRDFIQQLQI